MTGGKACQGDVFAVRFVQVEKLEGLPRVVGQEGALLGPERSEVLREGVPLGKHALVSSSEVLIIYLFLNLTTISGAPVNVSNMILDA